MVLVAYSDQTRRRFRSQAGHRKCCQTRHPKCYQTGQLQSSRTRHPADYGTSRSSDALRSAQIWQEAITEIDAAVPNRREANIQRDANLLFGFRFSAGLRKHLRTSEFIETQAIA